jgi:hypothetical protein
MTAVRVSATAAGGAIAGVGCTVSAAATEDNSSAHRTSADLAPEADVAACVAECVAE